MDMAASCSSSYALISRLYRSASLSAMAMNLARSSGATVFQRREISFPRSLKDVAEALARAVLPHSHRLRFLPADITAALVHVVMIVVEFEVGREEPLPFEDTSDDEAPDDDNEETSLGIPAAADAELDVVKGPAAPDVEDDDDDDESMSPQQLGHVPIEEDEVPPPETAAAFRLRSSASCSFCSLRIFTRSA